MLFVWFAAIHLTAVIAWEAQRRRATPWLDEEWAPRLLVSTAFLALLVPAIALVLDLGLGEVWADDRSRPRRLGRRRRASSRTTRGSARISSC